jgi:UDP-3-O-[3-hydroxymyristoyl] glucosamine N-acyltransferase
MPDPRFFRAKGPFSLSELAGIAGIAEVEIGENDDPARLFRDVAPLGDAGPQDISFLDNSRYVDQYRVSAAGGCIVHPDRASAAPADMSLLQTPTPYLAYARIARAFYPEVSERVGLETVSAIDPTATIGEGCSIGPGVVIGTGAEIGRGTEIGPNAVIGAGVVIGEHCKIGALSSVTYCLIGSRVRLYSGVRIGEAGFGFAVSPTGFVNVPQLGRVIIEDDVEIGANTTIDRGAGPDTIIGSGCRIDNLVQIGHNVRLGKGCILVAQTGISGSTTLEDQVVVGGQVGMVGHVTIGRGAQLGAQSGIMNDVPAGERYAGSPAMPARQWFRQLALIKKMSNKKVGSDG